MVDGHSDQDSGLYLDFLGVHLPLDLIASLKFFLGIDAGPGKHFYGFRLGEYLDHLRNAGLGVKSAPLGFFFPLFTVSVAVEAYHINHRCNNRLQGIHNGYIGLFAFCKLLIYFSLENLELLGHCGIQSGHSSRAVGG